jgi:hypothetical protein
MQVTCRNETEGCGVQKSASAADLGYRWVRSVGHDRVPCCWSALLVFLQLLNLLFLLGRSSASKDIELLVLRHEGHCCVH